MNRYQHGHQGMNGHHAWPPSPTEIAVTELKLELRHSHATTMTRLDRLEGKIDHAHARVTRVDERLRAAANRQASDPQHAPDPPSAWRETILSLPRILETLAALVVIVLGAAGMMAPQEIKAVAIAYLERQSGSE